MPKSVKNTNSLRENNDKYEHFIKGLELIAIGLKGCSASLDRPGLSNLHSEKKTPVRIFKHAYRVTDLGAGYFEASGRFSATVSESPDSDAKLSLECEFEAHLHAAEPISKESVNRFVNSEFQLVLIPYARQFFSSITAQMSIPPLVLPLSTGSSRNVPGAKAQRARSKGTRVKAR